MGDHTNTSPNEIKTLFKFITEFSADSVEWCPHVPSFFVCGNYHLDDSQSQGSVQKRLGRILLFSISCDEGLKLHQKVNTAGILDLKWCSSTVNEMCLLGAVNSEGILEIYKFDQEKLSCIASYSVKNSNEKDILLLSLDWSTGKYSSEEPFIVCSDSIGTIHVLCFSNNQLILINSWSAHNFQAWISAFYYWDPNIFFSGGDDLLFLMFDKRIQDIHIKKNREHEAGVTSLHSNKSREHVIVSGSYDEYIRLWDIRNLTRSVRSVKMPGTLWHLKWDPFIQKYLLAACMYGGVHIVSAANDNIQIVKSYYEHKNISYGADWCTLQNDDVDKFNFNGNVIIGTCSFYEKLLCVSKAYCDFSV